VYFRHTRSTSVQFFSHLPVDHSLQFGEEEPLIPSHTAKRLQKQLRATAFEVTFVVRKQIKK
jgi:hypothetical protein